MKPFHLLLAVASISFSACNSNHIEFNGTVPHLTNGVFSVKNGKDDLFSDAISNGTFHAAGALEATGYYMMDIMDNSHTNKKHDPYEVYLEPGKYTIVADTATLDNYPTITSSSKIQQDLSAYHEILNKKVTKVNKQLDAINVKLAKQKAYDQINTLSSSRMELELAKSKASTEAFKEFAAAHPQSEITAHLMADLDYESDPEPYYAIYQKMSPAAKNSPEGQELGPKLKALVKLAPGGEAPMISGLTPDGKKFDPKALDKQVYIVDFWRAGNEVSRLNHQDMISTVLDHVDKNKVGIISVSLDSRRDWWTTAIKDDHLTWTQYSDLKGDNSLNAQNWAITSIPTYYLVDGSWHIIEKGVSVNRMAFEISEYLKHHSHGNHAAL